MSDLADQAAPRMNGIGVLYRSDCYFCDEKYKQMWWTDTAHPINVLKKKKKRRRRRVNSIYGHNQYVNRAINPLLEMLHWTRAVMLYARASSLLLDTFWLTRCSVVRPFYHAMVLCVFLIIRTYYIVLRFALCLLVC